MSRDKQDITVYTSTFDDDSSEHSQSQLAIISYKERVKTYGHMIYITNK